MINKFNYIFLLIIFIGCYGTVRYHVIYHINVDESSIKKDKARIKTLIDSVSYQKGLSIDSKFEKSDTIAFFGEPYHYFTYYPELTKGNDTLILNFDYSGMGNINTYKDLDKHFEDTLRVLFPGRLRIYSKEKYVNQKSN